MTNPQPPAAAEADWAQEKAKEVAAEIWYEARHGEGPGKEAEFIVTALREAEQRGREQEREACYALAFSFAPKHGWQATSSYESVGELLTAIRQRGGEKQ